MVRAAMKKITLKLKPLLDKSGVVVGFKILRSDGVSFYGKTPEEVLTVAACFDKKTPREAIRQLLNEISH